MSDHHTSTAVSFWVATAIGWAIIGFGVHGLIERIGPGGALDVGIWVVGGNVAHDILVAPVTFAVVAAIALVIRRPWRAPLLAGLAASALVVATAYPALRGFGRKANNPTLLPLDYGTSVATALAVVWIAITGWCGLLVVARRRASRRTGIGVVRSPSTTRRRTRR
jgi:hypothetical protein